MLNTESSKDAFLGHILTLYFAKPSPENGPFIDFAQKARRNTPMSLPIGPFTKTSLMYDCSPALNGDVPGEKLYLISKNGGTRALFQKVAKIMQTRHCRRASPCLG